MHRHWIDENGAAQKYFLSRCNHKTTPFVE